MLVSTRSPGRASSDNLAWLKQPPSRADLAHRRRRPRRGGRCGGGCGRERRLPPRRAGRGDDQPRRSARGLRGQRRAARCSVLEALRRAADAGAAHLRLHQQGLRRARGCRARGRRRRATCRAIAQLRAQRQSAKTAPLDFHTPYGCSKGAADQYVLDYRAQLRPADGGPAHELHLRAAPDRHRGPGLGRAFPDSGAGGRADHHLRRRPAGARHPVRRRRGRRLSRRLAADRARYRVAPSTSAAGRPTR